MLQQTTLNKKPLRSKTSLTDRRIFILKNILYPDQFNIGLRQPAVNFVFVNLSYFICAIDQPGHIKPL